MTRHTVFVTGATGYKGRALIPRLIARRHRVGALARDASARVLRMLPPTWEAGLPMSGQFTRIFEIEGGQKIIELNNREATVIPKRVWHTAKVRTPSRMLFITRGAGTQHRSA